MMVWSSFLCRQLGDTQSLVPPVINSFNQHLWGSCSVPGTALLTGETLVRKMRAVPVLVGHRPQRNNQTYAGSL